MKNLYQFVLDLYNQSGEKDYIDFDEFIERFMRNNFHIGATHECFVNENTTAGYMILGYEVDHMNGMINILAQLF